MPDTPESGLLGLSLTDPVPAIRRNIGRFAQREPHLASVDSRGKCLIRGATAQITKHEIVGENATVTGAELVVDRRSEFAHPHPLSLRDEPGVNVKRPGHRPGRETVVS
jgi:hypothetical protein